MNRPTLLWLPALLLVALPLAAAEKAPALLPSHATPAAPVAVPAATTATAATVTDTLRVAQVTLVVGHRVFTEFRDRIVTPLDTEFLIGDSEYTGKVVEFQSDFTMDLASRKVTSRTLAPNNPAVRVLVWKNGAPDDTSWAFLKMPPHYGRKSMLAFQLTKVEFTNHATIEADSALIAPRPAAAAKPHTGGTH
ncbi:MAG: hypothetical protein K8R56_04470 [Candidatus Eisenbacteria bacterium]|nr:hypothetical protein [Candidatus Eisenbacteria bacterium]